MDLQEAQHRLSDILHEVSILFQKLPGSAILLRYIRSSYQNDPVRSAVELFLFLFAVRYLLAPTYSTKRKVKLTDDVSTLVLSRSQVRICLAHGTDVRKSTSWSKTGHQSPWWPPKPPLKKQKMRSARS